MMNNQQDNNGINPNYPNNSAYGKQRSVPAHRVEKIIKIALYVISILILIVSIFTTWLSKGVLGQSFWILFSWVLTVCTTVYTISDIYDNIMYDERVRGGEDHGERAMQRITKACTMLQAISIFICIALIVGAIIYFVWPR